MLWHYLDVIRRTPARMWDNALSIEGAIGLGLFVLGLLNRPLTERLTNHQWHGIRRRWALVPLLVLALYSFLEAEYESRQELTLSAETAKLRAERAEAQLEAEQRTPAKRRLKEAEQSAAAAQAEAEASNREVRRLSEQLAAQQAALQPRRLSDEQIEIIASGLGECTPAKVKLHYPATDHEARTYAEDLQLAIRRAHWDADIAGAASAGPKPGVSILYHPSHNQELAMQVRGALMEANVQLQMEYQHDAIVGTVIVFVGQKR